MKSIRDDPEQFIEDGCWEWAHDVGNNQNDEDMVDSVESDDSV